MFQTSILSPSKGIYLTDREAGYVKVICSEGCKVAFHMECCKKKAIKLCPTPDCDGQIIKIEDHH